MDGSLVKIRSARSVLPERNRHVRVNFLSIVNSSTGSTADGRETRKYVYIVMTRTAGREEKSGNRLREARSVVRPPYVTGSSTYVHA